MWRGCAWRYRSGPQNCASSKTRYTAWFGGGVHATIDFGAENVKRAAARAEEANLAHLVCFRRGDAEKMDFADSSFDGAICECGFCTFPDKRAAASEGLPSGEDLRAFVTDMSDPIYFVVWFYNQRGGAENLTKEANNDAGLAAHPSGRFDVNSNHFQLAMLAYNLNCWLMLFNREPQADATTLRHTTLATSRLRFLFVAAKI